LFLSVGRPFRHLKLRIRLNPYLSIDIVETHMSATALEGFVVGGL
jgi:hypothetical protein